MIRGLFIIFLFYWLGEAVSLLINGFIPGSVIGMLALFSCLMLKWVKPDQVRDTAKVITGNMAVFLIPSAVGIMIYTRQLLQAIVPIAVAILVSTTLTILVVALVQQFFENRATRKPTAE
jgi:holin-like protein